MHAIRKKNKEVHLSLINKKPHVVLIENDIDVQLRIKTFLESKNYQVSIFSNTDTILKACQEFGNSWDVVLGDVEFPEICGEILLGEIKNLWPDLPIILITVPNAADTAIEIVRKGAYDFLVKPIHLSQLLLAVERALHLNNIQSDLDKLRELIKSGPSAVFGVIGRSPKFLATLDVAKRVAKSNSNIFISGESGTGKEVFAKLIHNEGKRAKGPFVAINCSAIPENLLESELFGHAKGSFTGAHEKRIGLFEEAENGTLFLDEIGDLSLSLQAKLLRVLQEKKIKRVGENQFRDINARIISATHKNLSESIKTDTFREDLFYRLSVIPLVIPPLRERIEDILPLAESFLKRFSLENTSSVKSFSKDAIKYMLENQWRGNVRELENAVERAVVLACESQITVKDFSMSLIENNSPATTKVNSDGVNRFIFTFDTELPTAEQVMQQYMEFAVDFNGGARDRTAKQIGVDRKTLYKRLRPEADASLIN